MKAIEWFVAALLGGGVIGAQENPPQGDGTSQSQGQDPAPPKPPPIPAPKPAPKPPKPAPHAQPRPAPTNGKAKPAPVKSGPPKAAPAKAKSKPKPKPAPQPPTPPVPLPEPKPSPARRRASPALRREEARPRWRPRQTPSTNTRRGGRRVPLAQRAKRPPREHARRIPGRGSPVKELLQQSADGKRRCAWCGTDELYVAYHDREWGFPVRDDRRLFEKVCLEGFQAGLSWLTILKKRENFRAAFADFDFERVARFGKRDVTRLIGDAGIVRHRGKIESTVNNAQRALELVEARGSLLAFFQDYRAERPFAGWVAVSAESKALSKELKQCGWSFVGPTTMYAFLQSVGLVNDHAEGCAFRAPAEKARRAARAKA